MSLEFLEGELEGLQARGLLRSLEPLSSAPGPLLHTAAGEELIDFSSNDYLCLAADGRLKAAAVRAIERWGVGTGSARLVVGDLEEHEALEEELARFKGTEAALLFNSGWHANTGTIPALVGEGDLIVSDELNHASLIEGARLSKAKIVIARHADPGSFDEALARPARRKLLVTDTLFSMDGDLAPLRELREICDRRGALLYVDEAHATGIYGAGGRGVCEELGIQPDIQMGTLGKALGAFGAYVAGPAILRRWLIHRARSFVFTTSLPAAVCAAARAALRIVEEEPDRRARLLKNARRFAQGCEALGLDVRASRSPIVPVIVGEPKRAVALSAALRRQGILARPIRPPTVPEGQSRLRFALRSEHTEKQIEEALSALAEVEDER